MGSSWIATALSAGCQIEFSWLWFEAQGLVVDDVLVQALGPSSFSPRRQLWSFIRALEDFFSLSLGFFLFFFVVVVAAVFVFFFFLKPFHLMDNVPPELCRNRGSALYPKTRATRRAKNLIHFDEKLWNTLRREHFTRIQNVSRGFSQEGFYFLVSDRLTSYLRWWPELGRECPQASLCGQECYFYHYHF